MNTMNEQVLQTILSQDTFGLLRFWKVYNIESKKLIDEWVFDTVEEAIDRCDYLNQRIDKRIFGVISV